MSFIRTSALPAGARHVARGAMVGLILAIMVGATADPSAAQAPAIGWDPEGLELTREDLGRLLERLNDVANSSAYSRSLRRVAERDIDRIEERLQLGDFRVGDKIVLSVEGETELPDSVNVEPGPRITLPVIGSIGLEGVLRSELQHHLTKEIGRFINNPIVHARSMIRLSIQGEVSSPGFYVVPADMLVGEALMRAGGPATNAELDGLRIERGSLLLWDGEALQEMIVEGRTLDQLSLRAGDELFVPEATNSRWWEFARYALVIGSTVLFGIRVF